LNRIILSNLTAEFQMKPRQTWAKKILGSSKAFTVKQMFYSQNKLFCVLLPFLTFISKSLTLYSSEKVLFFLSLEKYVSS